jgi:hypothetical protein
MHLFLAFLLIPPLLVAGLRTRPLLGSLLLWSTPVFGLADTRLKCFCREAFLDLVWAILLAWLLGVLWVSGALANS